MGDDGDWSELDYDVLGEIALKLDAIEDFIYFSAVCRSWNCASSFVKRKWKSSMPCLLLAENHNETYGFRRNIFSLDKDKCYQLRLPESYGARCYGSSCGWIVTIDLRREIHMVNPFTKDRVRLPPQTTIPHQENSLDTEEEDARHTRVIFIGKVIVVQHVERGCDDDLIVLAIHTNWMRYLSFTRPGDKAWTSIVTPWPMEETPSKVPFSHRAVDIVCRDELILILYEDASLGYLYISDLSKQTDLVKAKKFLPSPEELKSRLNKYLLEMYLVESYGNLFMVHRHKSDVHMPDSQVDEDDWYETTGFEVFKLNFEMKKWEQVKELGDIALFVGNNHSMSVKVSDCRNCKSNCIYFTDDYVEHWDLPAKLGGHDMGVFHLENGEIDKFYRGDDVHSDFCTPFWFMPQFY